ncbi:heavy metal-associated isoprenylated plant protein 26-like isoform 1 [Hibiscus syriacus]|uniref:Heavy metal-associated isoprenylated plant protein 26-like isoform 1 n=1 Tax=Hibiscus syriacus TaxID=106335 RepID=A0A6A2Y9R6_HIBSY|nr:heavy metal-associated isoprenylated plant protein 26-like isoform 1 [Hibiscus syriacus]
MVPGLFTNDYLRKLTFGTKIETLSPGRCLTVTSTANNQKNFTVHKIFIGGVEITQPDLFNNGLLIIHGLQGYISPLSPFSCDVEQMTSLSFPLHHDPSSPNNQFKQQQTVALMQFMLRDAMLRLRNNGFSVLSLAMKINVRFQIVSNQFLTVADLETLRVGTTLATLDRGKSLVVTTGRGAMKNQLRINYVAIKVADMIRNIFLPFPHLHPTAAVTDVILAPNRLSTRPNPKSRLQASPNNLKRNYNRGPLFDPKGIRPRPNPVSSYAHAVLTATVIQSPCPATSSSLIPQETKKSVQKRGDQHNQFKYKTNEKERRSDFYPFARRRSRRWRALFVNKEGEKREYDTMNNILKNRVNRTQTAVNWTEESRTISAKFVELGVDSHKIDPRSETGGQDGPPDVIGWPSTTGVINF